MLSYRPETLYMIILVALSVLHFIISQGRRPGLPLRDTVTSTATQEGAMGKAPRPHYLELVPSVIYDHLLPLQCL
jgi:hypothetical protein